jgi:hypothetical protein
MVKFLAVSTDPCNNDRSVNERFARCMRAILGYDQVRLTASLGPGSYLVARAPLGAVKSSNDGERLVAELNRAFPGKRFFVEQRLFDPEAFLLDYKERSAAPIARVA